MRLRDINQAIERSEFTRRTALTDSLLNVVPPNAETSMQCKDLASKIAEATDEVELDERSSDFLKSVVDKNPAGFRVWLHGRLWEYLLDAEKLDTR